MEHGDEIVVSGGRIVTMDPGLGDFAAGHLLIRDGLISHVDAAPPSDASSTAEHIDATGCIVIPGMVDTHRHLWQTQLRAICADYALPQYHQVIRQAISPQYDAEDIYVGNRLGALEALNAGVTTVADFSHCMNTPEHADAAVSALESTGVRALFAYGLFPSSRDRGLPTLEARLADFERIAAAYDWNGLLSLGIAVTESRYSSMDEIALQIEAARGHGVRALLHTGASVTMPTYVAEMHDAGLLGDDQIHIHCNVLNDAEWRMLSQAGVFVSSSPETELNMGMGALPFSKCREHNVGASLSCDIISLNSGDLFTQMRLALAFERYVDNLKSQEQGVMPEALSYSARDALGWATIDGARACGLADSVGTLSPGKSADVVIMGGDALTLAPVLDPVGSVVFQGASSNVRDVIVGGVIKKRAGALIDVDLGDLARSAGVSANRILEKVERAHPDSVAAQLRGQLQSRGG